MDVGTEEDQVEKRWRMKGSKGDRKRIQKHGIKREEITTQAKFDKKKRRKDR